MNSTSAPMPEAAAGSVLLPDWPAPARVQALVTLRAGGDSRGAFGLSGGQAGGWNLGGHCGDDAARVASNRRRLRAWLPAEPCWLEQVHGCAVFEATRAPASAEGWVPPRADASVSSAPGVVLAVLTADCLPILLCDRAGTAVGIAHAGWRGLANGIAERTLERLRALRPQADGWIAWLGPAIGPGRFEVGQDVLDAFVGPDDAAAQAFRPGPVPGKWLADLFALARLRLRRCGVEQVYGGGLCTVSDPHRFYSFRRDRETGRMASLIWLD